MSRPGWVPSRPSGVISTAAGLDRPSVDHQASPSTEDSPSRHPGRHEPPREPGARSVRCRWANPPTAGDLEVRVFTLGVVLLVIAGVVTADIVLESSGPMPVAVAGHEVAMEDWRLFLFGMATGVLVVVAATLIAVGFSRDRRRRRDERLRRRELVAAGVPNVAAPMPATGPSAGPVQGPPATPVSGPIAVPGQSATAGPTTRPAAPAGGRTGPKGTPPAAQVTGSWQAIPAAARSDRSAPPDARTAP